MNLTQEQIDRILASLDVATVGDAIRKIDETLGLVNMEVQKHPAFASEIFASADRLEQYKAALEHV